MNKLQFLEDSQREGEGPEFYPSEEKKGGENYGFNAISRTKSTYIESPALKLDPIQLTQSKTMAPIEVLTTKKTDEHFNFMQRVVENSQQINWDLILKPRKKLAGHAGKALHFGWGSGELVNHLVSCDDAGQVVHWNAQKGKVSTFFDLSVPLYWVDMDPEFGRFAIAAAKNGRVYILQLTTTSKATTKVPVNTNGIYIIEAHKAPATVCKFLNAHYLVSGSADGELSLWDMREQKHFISTHLYHQAGITSVGLCEEDSNLLVTASIDKTCKIWDIRVQDPVQHEYQSHLGIVNDVEFMPGMITTFASCGDDGSIRIYDVRMHREMACIVDKNYNDAINSISFSNSGRIILAATENRTLKAWDTLLDADPFQYFDYGFLGGLQWAKLSRDGYAIAVLGKDGILGTAY